MSGFTSEPYGAKNANNPIFPERYPDGFFPTHPDWTRVLFRYTEFQGPIWEPAAGQNHMVDVLEEEGFEVVATELTRGQDFFHYREPLAPNQVTNPPYQLIDMWIDHSLDIMRDGKLCLFMDWSRVGSGGNRMDGAFKAYPPEKIVVIVNRMPKLVGPGGTPKGRCLGTHCWVIWDMAKRADHTRLEWTEAETGYSRVHTRRAGGASPFRHRFTRRPSMDISEGYGTATDYGAGDSTQL